MKQNQASRRQKASGIWNAVKKLGGKTKAKEFGKCVLWVGFGLWVGREWLIQPTLIVQRFHFVPNPHFQFPYLESGLRNQNWQNLLSQFLNESDLENDSLQPCLVFRIPLASYMEDFFYHATSSLIGGNVEPGHVGPETGARKNWRLWDCDRDIWSQCESVKKSGTFIL